MAAFVWTLTLRPLGTLVRPHAQSAARTAGTAASPAAASAKVHSGVLRLHILANSDAAADQAAKLAVRRTLLPMLEGSLGGARSAAQAEADARRAAPALAVAAGRTLRALGRPYAAHVVVGDAYFPAKQSGSLRLGPGVYPAVTVILGRGQGQNWWCLLFPDMCLPNPLASMSRSEPASGREILLGAGRSAEPPPGGLTALVHTLWSWL